jgi:glucose/arabinose dehydrogenase/PKD repeat protein
MGLRPHLLVLLGALLLLIPAATHAATLPSGFQETVVFSGLTNPTVVRFSPDGRVFVAEKSGRIKVFDSLSDPTATVFADLSTNVHNFWDRGMLGLALDPGFPANPYVYVLYAHDAAIGGTAPRWGTAGVLSDACPTPPGATADGCVISGRLSRLQANGNTMTGPEQVLIEDWCQQYPSHSTGSLAFGADGALYVSGGDGASFNFADWGQDGSPLNPCGDPPGGVGATLAPPTAEGGALRSQDLRTTSDPTSLDGAILRVDPATGEGLPDNPLAFSSDPNARRIVAHGLRNPFRIGIRPHTSEVWAGDVGWSTWEEIDRVDPAGPVENFGWPCYEGGARQSGYDGANLNICENLYATPNAVTAPYFNWNHSAKVVAGETCPTGSSSAAGIAFYEEGNYPGYAGTLFFADYSRDCIWAMRAGANGLPNPAATLTFAAAAANPVGLEIGPEGDLFYADFDGGAIRRIRYFSANRPPVAVATANPTAGAAPLNVTFNGTGSSDPDAGDTISYAWDLDEDGLYDDSTAAQPTRAYSTAGDHVIRLRVTDEAGASSVSDPVTITVGNSAPVATISTPSSGTTWRVGDVISFSGSASDSEQGTLPASSLSWELVMQHCPSNCHQHIIQSFTGVANGSFTTPDHEYPSYLELRLTATDAGGLTDTETLRLDPQTVTLNFASNPTGLQLVVGSTSAATPFSRTVIIGSANSVSAVSPQTLAGTTYGFSSWSNGGAQTHTIIAPAAPATYTATFAALPAPPSLVASYSFDAGSGPTLADISGRGHTGTISGATWSAAGKNGGALSFDGVNDWVTVADTAALDLSTAMTLEAWVRPTSTNRWRTVALKEQTGNLVYALYGNNSGQRASANLWLGSSEKEARSAGQLAANAWTHLAATYDGAAIRVYVNGALSGTTAATGAMAASTGPFRIGGNAIWDEFFAGQLDDLRLYNRALSATEVQTDMATPVGPPPPSDTQAPTVPGGLGATGGLSSVTLSWTASSDNVSVFRYNVHRSTTSGFTPSAANRIAQPTGTGYTDPGLAPGTYYYRVTAEDAAGNVSAPSTQATGVVTGDVTPPGAPGTLQATGGLGTANLSWGTATDNVAVVRYNVHRSTVAGFVPGVSNRIAQPTGTSYTDTVAAGTYFYRVTAEDAAGNIGAPSNEASATVTSDTSAPTVAVTAPAGGATVSGTINVQASASDNVGVTSVQFTLDGAALGAPDTSAPYATSWATTTATAGLHTLRAVASDAAGNATTSAGVTVTVDNSTPPPPTGLVAAWSFDAGAGPTAADATGKGHTGTISGATWSATGKNGGALSFDGVNDWVTVADASDLDLTNGMTLSAWVNPTASGSDWRTILLKENPGFMAYALYSNTDTGRPSGHVVIGGSDLDTRGTAAVANNVWTYLAATYDGANLRLYVNGTLVSTRAVTGSMSASTGPLRIGGNATWGEWFGGLIDNVRIYARSLSAAEVQTDMNAAVTP